ncbi:hypothetical protein RP20_CCG014180 [Aedes albopictus]|nr:hypothetical protein RP20_CCG014180 [Aedes albopictus]
MKKYFLSLFILGWMLTDVYGNPCEGINSGFVAHTDCTRYYSCVNGVAHEMQCPAVYPIFRPDTQMCDSGNPDECVACPATGLARFPVAGSCTKFILCVNGVQSQHECLNGLVFDTALNECNLAANAPPCTSVTCPANDDPANPTFIRHPTNCRQYYICVAGQPIQQECPVDTAFNPSTNVCDLQANVQCPALWSSSSLVSKSLSKADQICSGNTGIKNLPDPDDCSRYYLCMNGVSYSVACSTGLIFDSQTNKCGSKETSVCVKDVTKSPCAGNVGLKYEPHEQECYKYYMCMGETLYELTCQADKLFNANTGKCEASSTVICSNGVSPVTPDPNMCAGNVGTNRLPDSTDCTAFYVCVGEQFFRQTCADSLIFDVLTNDCNRPENSVCITEIATPPVAGQTTTTAPTTVRPSTNAPIQTTTTTPIQTTTRAPTTLAPTTLAPTTLAPTTHAPATTPAPANPSTPYCPPGQVFFYPHPDCSKFYRCVYGTLYVRDCPANQYWNQAREYCDHLYNVNCPARQ